ncbi:MAG: hypothetical protein II485_06955 [Firmicutes bacterium]|nr:hypothetical protein [Bacillota bacterium]
MNIRKTAALLLCLVLALSMLAGCGAANTNNAAVPENNSNVENSAGSENTVPVPAGPTEEELSKLDDITKAGAQAVAGDKLKEGSYDIKVASGSALFKILESKLVVVGDIMQLVLKVEGDAYSKMYAGSASEAASAQTVSEGEVDADGNTTFRIVIKSLNEVLKCSAYADAPGKWYDRTILADAESLDAAAFKPVETADDSGKKDEGKTDSGKKDEGKTDTGKKDEGKTDSGKKDEQKDQGLADGDYTVKVTFSGGTGKARILSPATLHVKNGKMTATVKWSSDKYDYMKVNGQKITPSSTAGGSVFVIPVPVLGKAFTVIGDTTAMSTPHEVEYSLRLDLQ